MVYTSAGIETCRSCADPVIFASIHILAFPFDMGIVSARSWSCLYYLLLVRPIIDKFCITAKPTFTLAFLSLFFGSEHSMESVVL